MSYKLKQILKNIFQIESLVKFFENKNLTYARVSGKSGIFTPQLFNTRFRLGELKIEKGRILN